MQTGNESRKGTGQLLLLDHQRREAVNHRQQAFIILIQ
jgi:hypothetical protein